MYRDADTPADRRIVQAIEPVLTAQRFKARTLGDALEFPRYAHGSMDVDGTDIVPIYGAWVRKGVSNLAVVHVGVPQNPESTDQLSALSSRVEHQLAPRIGYVSWLHTLALQLIWSGERLRDRTGRLDAMLAPFEVVRRGRLGGERIVERGDPKSNLVGIFVVDLVAKRVIAKRRDNSYGAGASFEAIKRALEGLTSL